MFVVFEADMMILSLRFSRDEEDDDLDAKRVVFAPLKRATATAAATSRVRIKDVMVVGVQNVLCSSRR